VASPRKRDPFDLHDISFSEGQARKDLKNLGDALKEGIHHAGRFLSATPFPCVSLAVGSPVTPLVILAVEQQSRDHYVLDFVNNRPCPALVSFDVEQIRNACLN
jgi:hypothetical protein